MQPRVDEEALDRGFPQGLQRLEPMQPLDQHEALAIGAQADGRRLPLGEDAFGQRLHLGRIEGFQAFHRDTDEGDGIGGFLEHGGPLGVPGGPGAWGEGSGMWGEGEGGERVVCTGCDLLEARILPIPSAVVLSVPSKF